jgi:hypothetical protein
MSVYCLSVSILRIRYITRSVRVFPVDLLSVAYDVSNYE